MVLIELTKIWLEMILNIKEPLSRKCDWFLIISRSQMTLLARYHFSKVTFDIRYRRNKSRL